jgi:hypothetical protein
MRERGRSRRRGNSRILTRTLRRFALIGYGRCHYRFYYAYTGQVRSLRQIICMATRNEHFADGSRDPVDHDPVCIGADLFQQRMLIFDFGLALRSIQS